MSTTSVNYWQMSGRVKFAQIDAACFSMLGRKLSKEGWFQDNPGVERVLYQAKIHESLSPEVVKFYCEFLVKLLGKHFTYRRSNNLMYFKLNLKGKNFHRSKTLMYLTAFRYLDEFTDIVRILFERKGNSNCTFEELFFEFQYLHYERIKGLLKNLIKCGNLCGHGLIADYGWTGYNGSKDFYFVTFEQFQKNLETVTQSAQSFYQHGAKDYKGDRNKPEAKEIKKDLPAAYAGVEIKHKIKGEYVWQAA